MFERLTDWRRLALRFERCDHTVVSAMCLAAAGIFWLSLARPYPNTSAVAQLRCIKTFIYYQSQAMEAIAHPSTAARWINLPPYLRTCASNSDARLPSLLCIGRSNTKKTRVNAAVLLRPFRYANVF